MLTRKLEIIAAAGRVKRFHNTPMLTGQTVGEHSFMVASLVMLLTEGQPPEVRVYLLMAALMHDVAEAATGDMPSPAKRAMDVRDAFTEYEAKVFKWAGFGDEHIPLSNKEERIIKIADILEGVMRCRLEIAMGNTLAAGILEKFNSYLGKHAPFSNKETEVIKAVFSYSGEYFDIERITNG